MLSLEPGLGLGILSCQVSRKTADLGKALLLLSAVQVMLPVLVEYFIIMEIQTIHPAEKGSSSEILGSAFSEQESDSIPLSLSAEGCSDAFPRLSYVVHRIIDVSNSASCNYWVLEIGHEKLSFLL